LDEESSSNIGMSSNFEDKESLGKISLSIRKKQNKRSHGTSSDDQSASTSMNSDDESVDYPLMQKVSKRHIVNVNGSHRGVKSLIL